MSQLTEEQVKVLHDVFIGYFAPHQLEKAIGDVQEKLKPLPSYGEVFHNERVKSGNGYTSWEGLVGARLEKDIEAGAQAVIRAFIEREVKPVVDSVCNDLAIFADAERMQLHRIRLDSDISALKKLIKERQ